MPTTIKKKITTMIQSIVANATCIVFMVLNDKSKKNGDTETMPPKVIPLKLQILFLDNYFFCDSGL